MAPIRKLLLSPEQREKLRRNYINGMDSASIRELRSYPAKLKIPLRAVRDIEVLKHVLGEASNEALTNIGITNPLLQRKIFASYLHSVRSNMLLDLKVTAVRAAKLPGKQINEKRLEERQKMHKSIAKERMLTFFKGDKKSATKYLTTLEQERDKFLEFLDTEMFPLQYTP